MPTLSSGVGWKGTSTSLAAAAGISTKASNIRAMVIAALKGAAEPLTTEEIADAIDLDYRSVQPRLSELKRMARVQDSGQRKISSRGKRIIAWEAL